MKNYICDYLISGGGIVGLSLAYQLIERKIAKNIIIIDKEPELGLHSSGRNSGVLHAGIYYEPNSLKSKVCISGAKRLKEWIKDKKLKINNCGKLIIPQKSSLDSQLDTLLDRGKKNGALVELINSNEIRKLAPDANITSGRGLWSPKTSVINPLEIIKKLREDLELKGVKIFYSVQNWKVDQSLSCIVIRENIKLHFGHLINASGLQSDKVAHKFNVGFNYKIIPFKGVYWKLRKNCPFKINLNLYPVPDLNVPFLGVHFTPNYTKDCINIGPTAIPALGRENYKFFENIEFKNSFFDFSFLAKQYFSNKDGFRYYVNNQALLGIPLLFLKAAKELIPAINYSHIEPSEKVGIRAQLFNLKKKEMIKDFLCMRGDNSTHILNSISPAFTASFSLADYVIDNYLLKPNEK